MSPSETPRSAMSWPKRIGLGIGALGAVLLALLAIAWFSNPPVKQLPATVSDDPDLPAVTIDGVTFHAEEHGSPDAPTVIVIHGGPGGDYKNLLVLQALADDYHVVFYDQRGTGLSPRVPASELTLDSSIEDLHRIVVHFGGGEPVALIGHSWGGMIGAYYATEHPELVARAVLAEPGLLTSEELRDFVAAMQPSSMSLASLWYLGGVLIETARVSGPDAAAPDDYFIERMMHAPGDDNAMNQYWCDQIAPAAALDMWRVGSTAMQAVLASAEDSDGQLHLPPLDTERYTNEILFVASACNTWIGVERQQSHAAMFPNARVEVVEGAGHLMFTDQPQASLAMIRTYLAQWPRPEEAGDASTE